MKNSAFYMFSAVLAVTLLFSSCKKDKEVARDLPDSEKPTANFTFKQVSADDPFTFKFENTSSNYKELRWEFGDDSTSTEISPIHTFAIASEYRILVIATNDQGYWAQKEVKIKLNPDSVLSFGSTKGEDGTLTLALNSTTKAASVSWYKGIGTAAKLVEKAPTTTIRVLPETYDTYSVRIVTPNGSKAELSRQVGAAGVLKDVTANGIFSVLRDNSNGITSGEGSLKLVDNDPKTKFVMFDYIGEFWAQLDFKDKPVILGAYSLTSGNDAPERDPKNFTLEGSNDLLSWTVVDRHVGETFLTRGLTKTYVFENSKAFRYYRLNIPVINGAGLIQLAEWRTYVTQ